MYPLKYHPGLAQRWHRFTQDQRLLMIANELNRAKNLLQDSNDPVEAVNAIQRAFELVDLTVEGVSGTLRFELLRFREALAQVYVDMTQITTMIAGSVCMELVKLTRILVSLDKNSYAVLSS
ncbi:MAG TPA: hypothetical protein VF399_03225 [bacterium]